MILDDIENNNNIDNLSTNQIKEIFKDINSIYSSIIENSAKADNNKINEDDIKTKLILNKFDILNNYLDKKNKEINDLYEIKESNKKNNNIENDLNFNNLNLNDNNNNENTIVLNISAVEIINKLIQQDLENLEIETKNQQKEINEINKKIDFFNKDIKKYK